MEITYLSEIMSVGVLNFSFSVVIFSHCCDRGLCLQDSEVRILIKFLLQRLTQG